MELHEFLEARIAEDEAVATSAMESTGGRSWESEKFYDDLYGVDLRTVWEESFVYVPDEMYESEAQKFTGLQVYIANHIARFDPARVLAECAAKRAVIRKYTSYEEDGKGEISDESGNFTWGTACGLELALEALAAPYRNHPDFNPDWAVA